MTARAIAEGLASHFPRLRGKVTVRAESATWWDGVRSLDALEGELSLAILGHLLNESAGPERVWGRLVQKARGGGLLMMEPASRRSAQIFRSFAIG